MKSKFIKIISTSIIILSFILVFIVGWKITDTISRDIKTSLKSF